MAALDLRIKVLSLFPLFRHLPIYDTSARQTVQWHLGRERLVDADRPYVTFVNNLQTLIAAARLTASPSELDSYLWIRGGYELWRKRPDTPMNGELKEFFRANAGGRLLKRLTVERE